VSQGVAPERVEPKRSQLCVRDAKAAVFLLVIFKRSHGMPSCCSRIVKGYEEWGRIYLALFYGLDITLRRVHLGYRIKNGMS
jgi:hypothetical protein